MVRSIYLILNENTQKFENKQRIKRDLPASWSLITILSCHQSGTKELHDMRMRVGDSIQREWYMKKKENEGDRRKGTIRACDSFVLAFVGGAGSMGCWCGNFIEHVRRKTTRLWKKKLVSHRKLELDPPSLVVYYKNKVMMLKITLEKRQNSLTIL